MTADATTKLIKLAAQIVTGEGMPPDFDDMNDFYRSTPMAERRRVLATLEKIDALHKSWGMQIKKVVDELRMSKAQTTPETPAEAWPGQSKYKPGPGGNNL